MAGTMFSKMLSFRSWKKRHKYTELEMNEHDPSATRSSFDESLGRIGASSLPEWPNFPFEEQLKNQQDDQQSTISATLTPKSRFYPTRSSVQRGSGFFVRLKRMWTLFPIQDISWIVAFSFTIGSTAFVVNGFFLLLALIDPETNFLTETPYATPASSVLGTLIFLIGGYAGFLEGLNFGEKEMAVTDGLDIEAIENTEIRTKLDNEASPQEPEPEQEPKSDSHSFQGERSVQVQRLRVSTSTPQADDDSKEVQASSLEPLIGDSAFIYLPTMHQLRTTYTHSLSFHAGWVQFLGTIVFSRNTHISAWSPYFFAFFDPSS